jgi:hypothetical protein
MKKQGITFVNGVFEQAGSIHVSVSQEVKKADDNVKRDIMDIKQQMARYEQECSPIVSYNAYDKAQ